jgi:hypothetical protein
MKKILSLLLFISLKICGQSITIAPSNIGGTPNGVIKTATSKIGLEHTDGTIRLNTYIGTASQIGGWLQTYTDHPLVFSTSNGSAQLFLNNDGNIVLNPSDGKTGNVGIGIEKLGIPNYKLDINGRSRIRHNGSTAGLWFNKSDNTEGAFAGMYDNNIFGFFGMGTIANWRFAFDLVNTKMGIGSFSPKHPLTFSSNIGDKISFWGGETAASDNHYGIGIQASALQLFVPSATENIIFGTGRSALFTENMRINGGGNVGIGTNNPQEKLHVNGKIRASNLVGSGNRSVSADANGNLFISTERFAFSAKKVGASNLSVLSNTSYTIPFSIEEYDYQSNFNNSTGEFTAPLSGVYHFDASIQWGTSAVSNGEGFMFLMLNNGFHQSVATPINLNKSFTTQISRDIQLTSGDVVKIDIFQTSLTTQLITNTDYYVRFSGHLVFRF